MGLIKNRQMAKRGAALQAKFSDLYDSPAAYRPSTRVGHLAVQPGYSAQFVLDRLSDFANKHGLTAGDAGILAVEFMDSIDRHRSYARAFDEVLGFVAEGQLLSVSGYPMRNFVHREGVTAFLEAAAVGTRPQAYGEYIDSHEEM